MITGAIRVLAITDEVGMLFEYAREACTGYHYQIVENTNASRDLMAAHELQGLVIDVVSENGLSDAVETRTKLGINYDLVTLLSFRVMRLSGKRTRCRKGFSGGPLASLDRFD